MLLTSADPLAHLLRVDEEQPPLGPQDQQALKGLVVGMLADTGRSTSAPRLRPMTYTRGWAVWLASPISERMIATTMPLSVPNTSTPTKAIAPSGTPSCAPCGWRGTRRAGSARPNRR